MSTKKFILNILFFKENNKENKLHINYKIFFYGSSIIKVKTIYSYFYPKNQLTVITFFINGFLTAEIQTKRLMFLFITATHLNCKFRRFNSKRLIWFSNFFNYIQHSTNFKRLHYKTHGSNFHGFCYQGLLPKRRAHNHFCLRVYGKKFS